MLQRQAVDELTRLCREVPAISVPVALTASAVILSYGNAVVIAGRLLDEPMLATTVGVPLLGVVGVG